MKYKYIITLLFISCSIPFFTYALDPQLTLQDHINMRQQQRRDYAENQRILQTEQQQRREAVIAEMSAAPIKHVSHTAKTNRVENDKKRGYSQWIILALLAIALLVTHHMTRPHEK